MEFETRKEPQSKIPHRIERRRFPRHRFIQDLCIVRASGDRIRATTFEIGACGFSVATIAVLELGEEVLLSPVLGKAVKAVVRSKLRTMYGFEFIESSTRLQQEILALAENLSPFVSCADV
jgi:hypothetical protein